MPAVPRFHRMPIHMHFQQKGAPRRISTLRLGRLPADMAQAKGMGPAFLATGFGKTCSPPLPQKPPAGAGAAGQGARGQRKAGLLQNAAPKAPRGRRDTLPQPVYSALYPHQKPPCGRRDTRGGAIPPLPEFIPVVSRPTKGRGTRGGRGKSSPPTNHLAKEVKSRHEPYRCAYGLIQRPGAGGRRGVPGGAAPVCGRGLPARLP